MSDWSFHSSLARHHPASFTNDQNKPRSSRAGKQWPLKQRPQWLSYSRCPVFSLHQALGVLKLALSRTAILTFSTYMWQHTVWEDIALPSQVTTESRLGLQPSVAFQVFLPFLQLFGLALFCFSSWHKSRHSYFEIATSKNDQFRHICRTRLSGALEDGTLAFCLKQLNIFFSGLKIFSCQWRV